MEFDTLAKEILFFDLSEDNFGTHFVKVTLTDTDGEQATETFVFDIRNGIHQQDKDELVYQKFEYETQENSTSQQGLEYVKVKIASIS
jgi:hypothetical protein